MFQATELKKKIDMQILRFREKLLLLSLFTLPPVTPLLLLILQHSLPQLSFILLHFNLAHLLSVSPPSVILPSPISQFLLLFFFFMMPYLLVSILIPSTFSTSSPSKPDPFLLTCLLRFSKTFSLHLLFVFSSHLFLLFFQLLLCQPLYSVVLFSPFLQLPTLPLFPLSLNLIFLLTSSLLLQ